MMVFFIILQLWWSQRSITRLFYLIYNKRRSSSQLLPGDSFKTMSADINTLAIFMTSFQNLMKKYSIRWAMEQSIVWGRKKTRKRRIVLQERMNSHVCDEWRGRRNLWRISLPGWWRVGLCWFSSKAFPSQESSQQRADSDVTTGRQGRTLHAFDFVHIYIYNCCV